MAVCVVDGCETRAQVKKMCLKHYHRVRRHGVSDEPLPARRFGPCSVDGCDKTERARGLCGMHLQRWYRKGTTDEPTRPSTWYCRSCKGRFPRENFPSSAAACDACYPVLRQEAAVNRMFMADGTRASGIALREKQDGKCAICGKPEALAAKGTFHIDHDHETGFVRGLLCSACNLGIGHFRDDPILMLKAIRYLRKHGR